MQLEKHVSTHLFELLQQLYGLQAGPCLQKITESAKRLPARNVSTNSSLWSERDVVLITYGDHVCQSGQIPLQALRSFLIDYQLDQSLSTLHLLPCFPYSSDDGFSVTDYRHIDAKLGDWNDVAQLGKSFQLMFDFVLNHCSRQHEWFQNYLAGKKTYDSYFIEVDPEEDLSAVTRPRSTPLLTPVETCDGLRHVWTTFSDDQIDLNYANPDVLVEMLDVLFSYLEHGARIVRLDAIAYLWKRIGTSCIHLPETHLVVKVMRTLIDAVAPGTLLLTETNVPHEENTSYFGDGDEAHLVYQFSLAPLLLDAFLSGDATHLTQWLMQLDPSGHGPAKTNVLNLTASHDGIGVRPLEGLVPQSRYDWLIEAVRRRGGYVSTRRSPNGAEIPYELNITYSSALDEPDGLAPELHARRFLSSQAVMLALRGIPGVYFPSLVGTPNDQTGVERSGHARTINRRKFQRHELDQQLARTGSVHRLVFDGYRRLLTQRTQQSAFHPDGEQKVVDVGHSAVISFLRTSPDQQQRIWILSNASNRLVSVDLSVCADFQAAKDILTNRKTPSADATISLAPWETVWLTEQDD